MDNVVLKLVQIIVFWIDLIVRSHVGSGSSLDHLPPESRVLRSTSDVSKPSVCWVGDPEGRRLKVGLPRTIVVCDDVLRDTSVESNVLDEHVLGFDTVLVEDSVTERVKADVLLD